MESACTTPSQKANNLQIDLGQKQFCCKKREYNWLFGGDSGCVRGKYLLPFAEIEGPVRGRYAELYDANTCEPLASEVDVAIVGGGIGGAYTAWRLVNSGQFRPEQLRLFERSNRVGGRFHSPSIGCSEPSSEDEVKRMPRCELGGMRIRSVDKLMLGVAEELGIELGPFHMNAGGTEVESPAEDEPGNPLYLRGLLTDRREVKRMVEAGRVLRADRKGRVDVSDPTDSLPYFLEHGERIQNLTDLDSIFNEAHDFAYRPSSSDDCVQVDPCDSSNGDRFMEQDIQIGGHKMAAYEYSTWAYARGRGDSQEKLRLGEAFSGYGFHNSGYRNLGASLGGLRGLEKGASVGIPDLPQNQWYKRPLMGMEELPRRLHENYTQGGGRTFMNMELLEIEQRHPSEEFPFTLTFGPTFTNPCSDITARTQEDRIIVRAKRVVLAMPKASLERIQVRSHRRLPALRHKLNKLFGAIGVMPLMKLFAAYPERWWENAAQGLPGGEKFTVGRFTTSTEMSQIFAWSPGTQQTADLQAAACGDKMGVVQMYATNAGGGPHNTWSGLTREPDQQACQVTDPDRCGECFGSTQGFALDPRDHVPTDLLDVFQEKLATIFKTKKEDIPMPHQVKYKIWEAHDAVTRADAIHYWRAGYKWWKLYPEVLEPASGLHIVGELFAFNQDWGEGALETAEHLLHEVMGLDLPRWLTRRDFCWSMPYYPSRRPATS